MTLISSFLVFFYYMVYLCPICYHLVLECLMTSLKLSCFLGRLVTPCLKSKVRASDLWSQNYFLLMWPLKVYIPLTSYAGLNQNFSKYDQTFQNLISMWWHCTEGTTLLEEVCHWIRPWEFKESRLLLITQSVCFMFLLQI